MPETKLIDQTSKVRWIRDTPSDPILQRQWSQTAIPWCTTHDREAKFDKGKLVGQGEKVCVISNGGPDHKWWIDT